MIKRLKNWWKNKFWMVCDNCNDLMKNYTIQSLVMTKEGPRDKFYCKKCTIKIRGSRLIEPIK